MADTPDPTPRPTESVLSRQTRVWASRVETTAMGFLGLGALLLLAGVVLSLSHGGGLVCLLLGVVSFLTGCIEKVRAEVLYVRAKLEKD